jgi:hypothetical protein
MMVVVEVAEETITLVAVEVPVSLALTEAMTLVVMAAMAVMDYKIAFLVLLHTMQVAAAVMALVVLKEQADLAEEDRPLVVIRALPEQQILVAVVQVEVMTVIFLPVETVVPA